MSERLNFKQYFGPGWAKKAMEILGYKSRKTFYAHIRAEKPLVMNYLTPMLDAYTEDQKKAIMKFTHSKEKADLIKDVSNSLKQKVS